MRKVFSLLVVLFLVSSLWASNTVVTATITDADSQTWNNGNYSVIFVPVPGTPANYYTVNGVAFSQQAAGTMSAVGVITVTLTDLASITPSGGQWQFNICPNASTPCYRVTTNGVTGASINLTSTLIVGIITPRFLAGPNSYGYSDTEASANLPGQTYYNVSTPAMRQWSGTAWGNIAGAGTGTVTSVATSAPLSGGPVTSTGSLTCPSCATGIIPARQYNMSCAATLGTNSTTTTNGTVSPGTSVLLTSATGFATGQAVYIAGAGAAGGPYNGVIQSVASNTLTVSPATTTSVTGAVVANYAWPVQTTTSGTVAPGTTVALTSANSFLPGQGIYIAGAGAASANYIGTIQTVVGNTATVTPATGTSVTSALVQHDETSALNSAIADVASGVTNDTIKLPSGICLFNGPLLQTSYANAIIPMPIIPYNPNGNFTGANGPIVRVAIEGTAPTAWPNYNIVNWIGLPNLPGTVIQTAGAAGNLFGGASTATDRFTGVQLLLKNVTLRAPDNPAIIMVNGGTLVGLNIENVSCDTLALGAQSTPSQPTNSNGQCIVFPAGNNSAEAIGKNIHVQGYYTAISQGEHLTLDHVSLYDNWQGFMCNVPATFHVGTITYLDLSDNAYGIVAGQACTLSIRGLDNEISSAPSWASGAANTSTIYDPNNYLHGTVEYASYNGGAAKLTRYGAQNLGVNATFGQMGAGNLAWSSGLVGVTATLLSTALLQTFVNAQCSTPTMTITPPQSPVNGVAGGCVTTAFNLTGRTITVRVPQLVLANANAYTVWDIGIDTTHVLEMHEGNGTLGFQVKNGGGWSSKGTIAYNSSTMLWWRFVESAGAVTTSYSGDGVTFTTLATCTATCASGGYTAANMSFAVQYLGAGATWPGFSQFDFMTVQ